MSAFRGKTLIIVNPAAQSGAAAHVGERLQRFLGLYLHDQGTFELVCTERPRQAIDIAAGAADFETELAVGGDGIVHEVANGLMRNSRSPPACAGGRARGVGQRLRTHPGYARGRARRRFAVLLSCKHRALDVGMLDYYERRAAASDANILFQTFSFGLDAAIALGTLICASARDSQATRFTC